MSSKEAAQQPLLTIIERTEAHYEVQEVEFGTVYRWCPKCVNIECECGERLTFTAYSMVTCPRCGADHAATLREELTVRRLEDQTLHPWRYEARALEKSAQMSRCIKRRDVPLYARCSYTTR